MNTKITILKAAMAGVLALSGIQAQADILKQAVRLGAYALYDTKTYIPVTTSGSTGLIFNGSGRFTIWYTAECTSTGYVGIEIRVDGVRIEPSGNNDNDTFCDFNSRGAMHTVTGRTDSLTAGDHSVAILAYRIGTAGYLSDSSLLVGK